MIDEVLLVGGHADGQLLGVPRRSAVVQAHEPDRITATYQRDTPLMLHVPRPVTYTRETVRLFGRTLTVFVDGRLTPAQRDEHLVMHLLSHTAKTLLR